MGQEASTSDKDECPWCKYMKSGPCRTVFEAWQACVDNVMDAPDGDASDESRRQAVEQCAEVTGPLFQCLAQHPEYYGPQLETMAKRGKENAASTAVDQEQEDLGSKGGSSQGSSNISSRSGNKGNGSSNTGSRGRG
eukprot:GHRR01016551.1.p1 GENE.GHRR01016551.1~~GHRR01016551.1.p1  ORF type:complete len:137 (+),score=49.76 GHRR01016551.1:197-607(+)